MGYKTIKILPNRQLKCKNRLLGITGDKNATVLQFEPCFSEINGTSVELHEMRLVFNNAHGSYVRTPQEDHTFIIPQVLTVDTRITLCIQFLLGDEVKWQSINTEFIFAKGADDSGYNIAVTQRESDLSDLRNSFSENIDEDYSESEWEELIGQLNEETPEESYQTGVLYQLRETLSSIAKFAVDSSNVAKFTINESIPILSQAFIRDKMSLIELLNDVLEPESEYTMSTTFNDIFEETARLPAEIQTRLNIAVTDAQVTYRRQLDTALNAVVQQYSLSVDLDKADTWLSTLNNLSSLCEALASGGGEITEDSVSIPFKVTLDGTTTKYEFTMDSDGNPIIQEVG